MPTPLKVLLLEDDPLDAELNVAALEAEGYQCQWERVQTRQEFLAALDNPDFDILLVDYNLPGFDGMSALKLFVERDLDIPVILVSGNVGEERAIDCLKAGATDYVLKERLSRLAPSVKRALEEFRLRRRDKQRTADMQLFQKLNQAANSGASMYELSELLAVECRKRIARQGVTVYLLSEDKRSLRIPRLVLPAGLVEKLEQLVGFSIPPIVFPVEASPHIQQAIQNGEVQILDTPQSISEEINYLIEAVAPANAAPLLERLVPKIRELLKIEIVVQVPLATGNTTIGLLEFSRLGRFNSDEIQRMVDIAEQATAILARKQAEMQIDRLARVIDQASVTVAITDLDGKIVYANPYFEVSSGYSVSEALGQDFRFLKSGKQDAIFYQRLWDTITSGRTWQGPIINKRKDGSLYYEDATIFPIKTQAGETLNYAAVKRDISAEVHAREQIERQLTHLKALHMIDTVISASMDINLTITSISEQIKSELQVDAVSILIYDPALQSLDSVARKGFRTRALERTHLRLGRGLAGKAALQREVVHISNLQEEQAVFSEAPEIAAENFVTYWGIPLIAKGQNKGVLEIFHRSELEPDDEWLDYLNTLASQVAIAIDNATLFENLQRSNTNLRLAYDTTLEGWARALEMRDMETEGHSRRVTEMTLKLAEALGTNDKALVHIRRGAALHDIGKMSIPDSILRKPGPLTDEEWAIMRRHPQTAYDLLSKIDFLTPALDIPLYHHEKWDGTGYPYGLSGEAIPHAARIFAVVDVYDALRSHRPYREPWPQKKVLEYMRSEAGKHFDPHIVEVFLRLIASRVFKTGELRRLG